MNVYTAEIKIQLTLFYRMHVYQIVYPRGLELVQPSECMSNLSYRHRGDIIAGSYDTTAIRKFNYTALFMRHSICSIKLNSMAISIQDFIRKSFITDFIEKCSSFLLSSDIQHISPSSLLAWQKNWSLRQQCCLPEVNNMAKKDPWIKCLFGALE